MQVVMSYHCDPSFYPQNIPPVCTGEKSEFKASFPGGLTVCP